MCFNNLEIAERFVEVMSELSILYMEDKIRFSMQFIADIMKKMQAEGLISIEDLYELPEIEIIEKIKNCKKYNISECFELWQNSQNVMTSKTKVCNKYCINVKAKKRYINPLVQTDNGVYRINEISSKAQNNIDTCLNYDFDRYIYMDFDFNNEIKVLKKIRKESNKKNN